jgi:hypothetical protein
VVDVERFPQAAVAVSVVVAAEVASVAVAAVVAAAVEAGGGRISG